MSSGRIMFYVQYLLGIGHVRRSSLIVQALCRQGAQVDVIFGGMPVPSMSFGSATVHQLKAIKSADAAFSGLANADGSILTESDKQARSAALLSLCDKIQPDLIVTETYPFGRRQMRFELLPLLDWIKKQPKPPRLVSSIRDILQRRSPEREQECVDIINRHYQHVLVHGDANFFPLQKSFPESIQIDPKISYSGYVCPTLAPNHTPPVATNAIIVSIGGGSVGSEILHTALALCKTGYASDCQWLLVTGPNMPEADKAYFNAQCMANLQVVELAADFLATLSAARVSISMGGYNTVMDLLLTKVPAVVIPFEGEGETEQLTRTKVLADAGVLALLRIKQMDTQSLRSAIEVAMNSSAAALSIDSQGALKSANLLIQWAEEARDSHG
ncbi:MAG: hypothetical protein HRU05_19285 [Oceanospirillaceae bacterium]|nr:hypothetical protein [Oceanospirillaceae bacterium]